MTGMENNAVMADIFLQKISFFMDIFRLGIVLYMKAPKRG